MPNYSITVNGQAHTVDISADTPLLWVLRDHLGLAGTKYGCGIALCGTCTVHLNGNPARSCVITIDQAQGSEVVTIEGLSQNGSHPVQQAWVNRPSHLPEGHSQMRSRRLPGCASTTSRLSMPSRN